MGQQRIIEPNNKALLDLSKGLNHFHSLLYRIQDKLPELIWLTKPTDSVVETVDRNL
jgi:hypothetical protein